MCEFEDIDLYQVRPVRHKDSEDRGRVAPVLQKDNSPEELEEEEIKAEEDVWFT